MINIANAKLFGELKEEHSNLLNEFNELNYSQLTMDYQEEFLRELSERLKRYFKHVNFDVKETTNDNFEATYKGITYNVVLDNALTVIRKNTERYTIKAIPASRVMRSSEKVVENEYLKNDIEELYSEIRKLRADLKSLQNNEFSYWFVEKEKELYDIDKVVDEIYN